MNLQKRIFIVAMTAALLILSLCILAGCEKGKPFALRFNGVACSYDDEGNLTATLNFSEAEEGDGRINVKDDLSLNCTFRYKIDENGEITFDFDTEDTASGTLHNQKIDVTATVNGKTYVFSGEFYKLTVKADDEITEEGYVTANCPLDEVVAYPPETVEVAVNGEKISVTELKNTKMPKKDTVVEIIDPTTPNEPSGQSGVVKAFNLIEPKESVITQTAVSSDDKYIVTVITANSVTEYTVGSEFTITNERGIVGKASASLVAAEERSALERAYQLALEQSKIAPEDIVGFDFDADMYMGKAVYKVEIEELGTKYKFIFDAESFDLLSREIEFENSLPTDSYIGESKAREIALKAVSANNATDIIVRSIFEEGKKQYRISFNYENYRYDVNVDAVSGEIVKYSKSILENNFVDSFGEITADEAKTIALAFVFPDGADDVQYTFRKIKLDYDDGAFIYEVELIANNTEYEFEISAKGEILDVEIDNYKNKGENLPQNKQFISREQAIAAVKEIVGENAYILEVEIEEEYIGGEKRYFYELEVKVDGVKSEYRVDAISGKAELYEGGAADGEAVITEDDAIRIAIEFFHLEGQNIDTKKVKLEREDGKLCFEVKLYIGNTEYKAEIDAENGTVIKSDTEYEDNVPPTSPELITSEQAIAAVKEAAGENATIVDVDLEYENGRYIYEIEVRVNGREYDYYVDAQTGKVSLNEHFVDGGKQNLSEEEALDIAFKFFKVERRDAIIHKVKLDRDDGRLCYEIEFFIKSLKYEIEIDADTGEIIEQEVSYD